MTTPLSLYIHIPWCIRKCPYCDFNSHESTSTLPVHDYIDALRDDLVTDIAAFAVETEISSIFLGGGTPSLLPGEAIADLVTAIAGQLRLAPQVEITLEANPGTVGDGMARFAAYHRAGVNRLSLGVQSFDNGSLAALGRIHSSDDAVRAFHCARRSGFDNINVDLMHGLPGQDVAGALADLQTAIDLSPEHISWYQLTIEPNTVFYKRPPVLPDEDALWEIYEAGMQLLERHGYARYEVSAFARPGRRCHHNLNYWQFGDYLGIGAGAHGKITLGNTQVRTAKTRLPRDYLSARGRRVSTIAPADLPIEFLMNGLRLTDGFSRTLFEQRTGLAAETLDDFLRRTTTKQLVMVEGDQVKPTRLGLQYLNSLLVMAMEDAAIARKGSQLLAP